MCVCARTRARVCVCKCVKCPLSLCLLDQCLQTDLSPVTPAFHKDKIAVEREIPDSG